MVVNFKRMGIKKNRSKVKLSFQKFTQSSIVFADILDDGFWNRLGKYEVYKYRPDHFIYSQNYANEAKTSAGMFTMRE